MPRFFPGRTASADPPFTLSNDRLATILQQSRTGSAQVADSSFQLRRHNTRLGSPAGDTLKSHAERTADAI